MTAMEFTAQAAPVSTPSIYWNVKTALTRTREEKVLPLAEMQTTLTLASGHRCDITATSRTETPAAFIFTRVLACASPDGVSPTTGTMASCSIPRVHGVASISAPGKWFVFQGKEASPLNVTLSCGLVPE